MLIACHTCHRQYDVGGLAQGAKVRCYCGALNEVPPPRSHDLEMLHCASCGGELQRDSQSCGYCDAELTLADRGVGDACPECYARLVKDAAFCSSCGCRIHPQPVRKVLRSQSCPRCDAPLSLCEIPGGSFSECTACGGIWLDEDVFVGVTRDQDASSIARFFPAPGNVAPTGKSASQEPVRYLPCPECGQLMNRKNFARCSGVIIDWCKGHGYWFDTHELERIVAFIRQGGLEKARRLKLEEPRPKALGPQREQHARLWVRPRPLTDQRRGQRRGVLEVVGGIAEVLGWVARELLEA